MEPADTHRAEILTLHSTVGAQQADDLTGRRWTVHCRSLGHPDKSSNTQSTTDLTDVGVYDQVRRRTDQVSHLTFCHSVRQLLHHTRIYPVLCSDTPLLDALE